MKFIIQTIENTAKKMNKIRKILIACLFTFTLSACSNQTENQTEEKVDTLTYSNLMDEASQKEVRKTMEVAGISAKILDTFFGDVDFFNDTVEDKGLTTDGFVTIDSLVPEYDVIEMMEMWESKNPEFLGYNCRITSYDLAKDALTIGKINTANTDFLAFDQFAIASSPRDLFNETEYNEFETLYAYIPTELTKDVHMHVKNIQEDWQEKAIEFPDKDNFSLISVFFHEEEGYLFIGHMGLLFPTEDGELLFLEKLSFQEPYQAIKFSNRAGLNTYLMNKYDLSWDQPTAAPFILENNELLEGYQQLPKNTD